MPANFESCCIIVTFTHVKLRQQSLHGAYLDRRVLMLLGDVHKWRGAEVGEVSRNGIEMESLVGGEES